MTKIAARALAVVLLLAGLGGCTDEDDPPESGGLSGTIIVFADSSLAEAFADLGSGFEKANPEAKVEFEFENSEALADRVAEGYEADLIATADEAGVARIDRKLVPRQTVFARNSLTLVVGPDNPLGITGLPDLARDDVKVALCDPEVPCGALADQLFEAVDVSFKDPSREPDGEAVVAKVAEGDADVGVVYSSEAAGGVPAISRVDLLIEQNPATTYAIGVVESTEHRKLAQAFISFVLSGKGQQLLQPAGFSNP